MSGFGALKSYTIRAVICLIDSLCSVAVTSWAVLDSLLNVANVLAMISSVALSFEAKSFVFSCMVVLRFATPSCMAGIAPVNIVIDWDCFLSMAFISLTWGLVLLMCSVKFAIL